VRSTYTFALHLSTMKKPLLFLLVAFFSLTLSAQKVYYIYLQTEDQEPFYAKFLNKMYNSTQSGYLIISNLADSSYKVNIGFPSGVKPEMRFVISTNGSDRGFIIKDTTEPIILIDQTTNVAVKAENDEDKRIIGYETKTDKFSTILSKAADDPTLLKVPIRAKEEPKAEEQKQEVVVTKAEEPTQKEEAAVVKNKKTKGKKKAAPVDANVAKKETAASEEPKNEMPVEETKKEVAVTGEPKSEEVIKVNKEPNEESAPSTAVAPVKSKKKSKKLPAADIPAVAVSIPVADKKETAAVQEELKPVETPKQEEAKPAEQPKQVVLEQPKAQPQPETPTEPYRRSVVTRAAETSTTEGFGLVYYDIAAGAADTIRLLIPNPKVALVADNATKQDDGPPMLDPQKVAAAVEEKPAVVEKVKRKRKELVVKTEPAPVEKVETPVEVKNETIAAEQPVAKTDVITTKTCAADASEKDFFKLRKSMAGKITDESMIEEARKYFRTKCFTTEQIRYLSTLFLTSAGKYQFFDAAYDHTSNKEKFSSLQEEIKDAYYLKRFKALVGE
jgi:hypothetical protein